jgi:hypothetical protein
MTIKLKKHKKTNIQNYLINLLITKILTNTMSFKSKIKIKIFIFIFFF